MDLYYKNSYIYKSDHKVPNNFSGVMLWDEPSKNILGIFFFIKGNTCRFDGPSTIILDPYIYFSFSQYGIAHREDGPAVIKLKIENNSIEVLIHDYYIDGDYYKFENFFNSRFEFFNKKIKEKCIWHLNDYNELQKILEEDDICLLKKINRAYILNLYHEMIRKYALIPLN